MCVSECMLWLTAIWVEFTETIGKQRLELFYVMLQLTHTCMRVCMNGPHRKPVRTDCESEGTVYKSVRTDY